MHTHSVGCVTRVTCQFIIKSQCDFEVRNTSFTADYSNVSHHLKSNHQITHLQDYSVFADENAGKRVKAWWREQPIISPVSHATAARPSCRSGRGRGSTAGSHRAAAPRWHLYIQTGLQGWVPCTAPWPAQTPGPPTDPHSSWSVTGDRHGRKEGENEFLVISSLQRHLYLFSSFVHEILFHFRPLTYAQHHTLAQTWPLMDLLAAGDQTLDTWDVLCKHKATLSSCHIKMHLLIQWVQLLPTQASQICVAEAINNVSLQILYTLLGFCFFVC